MANRIEIIGLMSGTSLDGLDVAHVGISFDSDKGDSFEPIHFQTFDLPNKLRNEIRKAPESTIQMVSQLDYELGHYFADCVDNFIITHSIDSESIAAIGCHGQTILHQPQLGYTLQIGNGNILAYRTGIRVINDFRSHDVYAGGQGAPLVPIGDFGLFHDYAEAFLNLGGFANLSFKDTSGQIRAFDISPANLPLNRLIESTGQSFDRNGELSRQGEIDFFLLDLLNSLSYYDQLPPKSLGTEWLEEHFYPLIRFDKETKHNLRTLTEHIAYQISKQLEMSLAKRILITGGGAKNIFLIERIKHYYNGELILPSDELIDYKEAIIFAYLAALKLNNRVNSLSSVTGANRDMIGGVIHDPGYIPD